MTASRRRSPPQGRQGGWNLGRSMLGMSWVGCSCKPPPDWEQAVQKFLVVIEYSGPAVPSGL